MAQPNAIPWAIYILYLCLRGWDRKFRLLQQDITYYLHHDSWCLCLHSPNVTHTYFMNETARNVTQKREHWNICILNCIELSRRNALFSPPNWQTRKTISFWILACLKYISILIIEPITQSPVQPILRIKQIHRAFCAASAWIEY